NIDPCPLNWYTSMEYGLGILILRRKHISKKDGGLISISSILLCSVSVLIAAGITVLVSSPLSAESGEPRRIHPDFSVTPSELEERTAQLPENIQRAIRERPQYFLELIRRSMALPDYLLRLVDKSHPLPEGYKPDSIVELSDYNMLNLNKNTLTLHSGCMPDLLAMNEAARRDGIELVISSTYRTYEYQKGLYERYVKNYGQEEADRFSARPGTSQHQLGTAIDFGSITKEIAHTSQGRWLAEHAWKYGFSLSYPEGYEELTGYMWEPWHFRYISRTGTRLQREFFGDIQQHMTEFLHSHREYFEKALKSDIRDSQAP
ncbi:MAG: M15 family metallopeptidase, partial [Spirochaetaceae bacterium]